ncbi:MAG: hypothetical protein RBS87_00775, partial [Acholeplasma sp.]|nr:hypothetical protein [Acholeplasma sp.]
MTNKEQILYHQKLYPNMLLQDHVKRIHQMIFGPAHAHSQPSLDKVKQYMTSELHEMKVNECGDDIIEIGHDFVRVDLGLVLKEQTTIELLSQAFVSSMNPEFIDKEPVSVINHALKELEHMIELEALPYNLDESISWLDQYRSLGYPAIHHSDTYRDLYHPHYRVIHSKYLLDLKK